MEGIAFFLAKFFFKCTSLHRDLHSFPTRRSSDLGSMSTKNRSSPPVATFFQVLEKRRSEEHTSELQSRFDLVCSLLLEKKKKNCSAYGSRPMSMLSSVSLSSGLVTLSMSPLLLAM